jgi:hypothetical protein
MERPQVAIGSQTERDEFGRKFKYGIRSWLERAFIAGLLEARGVELLEWRSSPAAATPTIYLRLKIRRKENLTN